MKIATKSKRRWRVRSFGRWTKKICEIRSTTNKVISAHVDLPQVDNARSAYANAFEFGPRDFDAGEILSPSLYFPQSDLGRRADSRWALPQISSNNNNKWSKQYWEKSVR